MELDKRGGQRERGVLEAIEVDDAFEFRERVGGEEICELGVRVTM